MDTVQTLASAEYEGRAAGTPGGVKARAWVRDRLQRLGLRPMGESFEQSFPISPRGRTAERTDTTAAPAEGANLLALCAGTDPSLPLIVLSAHYDHVGIRDGAHLPRRRRQRVRRCHPARDRAASASLSRSATVSSSPRWTPRKSACRVRARSWPTRRWRRIASRSNVNLDMIARGDKGEIYVSGLHHNPNAEAAPRTGGRPRAHQGAVRPRSAGHR